MEALNGLRRRSLTVALAVMLLGALFAIPSAMAQSSAGAGAAAKGAPTERFLALSTNPRENAKPVVLGFGPIHAVDVESAAVEATRRNAAANGVELDVRQVDALDAELPSVDLVLANIHLAAVQAVAPRLKAKRLVTAGYFHSRLPEAAGFVHVERRIDGGWAADLFERQ